MYTFQIDYGGTVSFLKRNFFFALYRIILEAKNKILVLPCLLASRQWRHFKVWLLKSRQRCSQMLNADDHLKMYQIMSRIKFVTIWRIVNLIKTVNKHKNIIPGILARHALTGLVTQLPPILGLVKEPYLESWKLGRIFIYLATLMRLSLNVKTSYAVHRHLVMIHKIATPSQTALRFECG